MANFNVSYFVKIRDEFSRPARQIAGGADLIRKKTESLRASLPRTKKEFDALSKSVRKAGQSMQSAGVGLGAKLTAPLALLGGVALKQSANLETLGTGFEVMLGSAEKGKAMMNDLLKFTATTPFQLQGVAESGKQLLAFGVAEKDVINRLRMLGDISAGANVPLKDMAGIFGKVKAKGKLMTEEILQMSDRGIPIVDVLAKGFGKTKDEIFEMASKSQISFDDMQKAMKSMTSEGGIFFEGTLKQSRTLAGRFSTLKDNVLLTAASVGDVVGESIGLNKLLADMSNQLAPLAEKIKAFAKENPKLTKMIVIFTGIAAVIAPLLITVGQLAFAISSIIAIAPALAAAFMFIKGAVLLLTGGFLSMAAAVIAATWPFIAIVAGIFLVYKAATILGELFAKAFPNAASAMTEAIQSAFGSVFGFIDDAIERFKNFVNTIKTSGVQKIAAFFGIGGDETTGGDAIPQGQAVTPANSQTDVNVQLRAPEKTVESVKTKTKGNNGSNVGVAMVEG